MCVELWLVDPISSGRGDRCFHAATSHSVFSSVCLNQLDIPVSSYPNPKGAGQ